MKRVLVWTAFMAFFTVRLFADPPKMLKAKAAFEHLTRPTETERVRYIVRLISLRWRYAKLADQQWRWDVDAEILSHPAPPDSALLSSSILGAWASPRHEYLYRPDCTWTMLPEFEQGIHSTHGTWRIDGNDLLESYAAKPSEILRYKIILITDQHLVFSNGYVFYHTRINKHTGAFDQAMQPTPKAFASGRPGRCTKKVEVEK